MKAGHRWVIPCEELRPLVEEWGKRNGYVSYGSFAGRKGADQMPTAVALEFRSGVPYRRISGILNDTNDSPNVSFDTADKLLCGMDMVDEWHGRLASYYEEPIEVSAAEARRLNEKENMERDIRDPAVLGTVLLREASGPLSRVYDENKPWLEKLPDWTGDGFMSSNPAEHHSKTPQADNERIKARA